MRRLALLVAVVGVFACKKADESPAKRGAEPTTLPAPAATKAGTPIQPGELRAAPEIAVGFGVIAPKGSDVGKLEAAAKKAGITNVVTQSIADLSFDRGMLRVLAGDKLTPADLDGIVDAAGVVFLQEVGKDARATLDKAASVTAELAESVGGWVMDPEAQRFQTATAFRATVPVAGKPVDIRDLVVVKAVQDDGELPFLLTAGMGKFGLPELYVRTLPRGRTGEVTTLINATAQALATGATVTKAGELSLDLSTLGEGWSAAHVIEAGGSAKVTWKVAWVQEPDGDERAVELIPPGGATTEAIEAMLSTALGLEDSGITEFRADDPEMLAAFAKARTELAAKRAHFAKGVPRNEKLIVKAPFTYPDGGSENTEWMWVDVVRWQGDTLEGTLDNDPVRVTGLKAGAPVKFQLGTIADFLHTLADGTEVGGYTIEVARKRGLIE